MTAAELEDALARGRAHEVRDVLRGRAEAERRALRPVVSAFASRQRREWDDDGWVRGGDLALAVARAGTCAGAAAAVPLLTKGVWRWRDDDDARDLVLGVLLDRAPGWLPALLERAAQVDAGDETHEVWQLVEGLRLALGAPRPAAVPYLRGLAGQPVPGATWSRRGDLAAELRADRELRTLVPPVLDVPDVGVVMARREQYWEYDAHETATSRPAPPEETWPGALRMLSDEGLLDREALLDQVLDVLLRGGHRDHLTSFGLVLRALDPTADEVLARLRACLGLLGAGTGPVAADLQRLLRGLDTAGWLPLPVLVEATDLVLSRREKGLATTQLAWAERAARRDGTAAAALLPALAAGLRHERRDVQERALAAVGVLLPLAGPADRSPLTAAAEALPPALQARAAALLGPLRAAPDDDLPPPLALPGPVRVRDLRGLADAVAQHLEAADPLAGEQVLDGVAALHAEPGLAQALAPFLPRLEQLVEHPELEVDDPVSALLRRLLAPARRSWTGRDRAWWPDRGAHGALGLRAAEVEGLVRTGVVRRLLALPDTAAGLVDPDRVAAELGDQHAGSWDLAQTALRLPPDAPQALRDRLGSTPVVEVVPASVPEGRVSWDDRRGRRGGLPVALVRLPPGLARDALLRVVLDGGRPLPERAAQEWWEAEHEDPLRVLLALPSQREVAAAHLLVDAVRTDALLPRGSATCLVLLPEAAGPTGVATALALGYALANAHAGARTAAVDALHGFAQHGGLDAAAAGRVLGDLVGHDAVKPGRVATALADALRGPRPTGLLVRDLLLAALPALLTARRRGLHELLTVAADACHGGPGAPVQGLDAVADEKGTTRLHVEARRLRDALRGQRR